MKITVDIDCTPAEARAFLGLPDVEPMQKTIMAEVERQLMANVKAMDPETMVKTWLPASIQGMEQLQKMFWGQMTGQAGKPGGDKESKKG